MSHSKDAALHKPLSLVWLRRDLRMHDHAALAAALYGEGDVQPFFVFDIDILARFGQKDDRRLTFLAETLCALDAELKVRGGGLLVFHGTAESLVPRICRAFEAERLIAARDHEPGSRARDASVEKTVASATVITLVQDSFLRFADEVLKKDGTPYVVFAPYFRLWRSRLDEAAIHDFRVRDQNRYADIGCLRRKANEHHLPLLDLSHGADSLLQAMCYRRTDLGSWTIDGGKKRLSHFISGALGDYPDERNDLVGETTSQLSPYIRHGLVSIRECARAALGKSGAEKWLSEIAWRDFYASILYHFPEVVTEDFVIALRGRIRWRRSKADLDAWKEGRTGYPVVDAGMRQLREIGWMHNRARLITSGFLTKHLRIDWREGEEHFAQYLMDYELSSNNGNWQWSASTGSDPQPYFRVFNPITQGEKFDPTGDYVRRYVPQLRGIAGRKVHQPWEKVEAGAYPRPIVEHAHAREAALAMFRQARKESAAQR